MKRSIVIVMLFMLVASPVYAWIYPPSPLCDSVDRAWREGREGEIITLVEQRLKESPENPLALFLGFHYYTLWEPDNNRAISYLERIEKYVAKYDQQIRKETGIDNPEPLLGKEFPTVESMRKEKAVTSEQKKKLQQAMKKESSDAFPGTMSAQVYAKGFASVDPAYAAELAENYSLFQKRKVQEIEKIGLDFLKKDTLSVLGKQKETAGTNGNDLPHEFWPESFKKVDALAVRCTSNCVNFLFWKLASTYDGVNVYFDDTVPKDAPAWNLHYEKMGPGIYWYHSAL